MTRRQGTIGATYFDALYAADADPWRFETSPYERDKYAATLAALPARSFPRGLEVGCSIGVLTQSLARRCGDLLALDVAEAALDQARRRCPTVVFERRAAPDEWPPGQFDLIVLSEMLYYLDRAAIRRTARHATGALRPGGCILLVHYLGETDYPTTGNDAAVCFIDEAGLNPAFHLDGPGYRIDRLDRAAIQPE
jgi:SAM-dependent methyltransferase